jgi:hypothetical protein
VNQWINWSPNEGQQAMSPTRRPIKTHAPAQLAPWKGGTDTGIVAGCKVIIVTRNPMDTAVSMYHHAKDVPVFEYTGDFNHFLEQLFLPGAVEHGCYWAWTASWWKVYQTLKDTDRVMWVAYEDLNGDLAAGVPKIASFCGIDASAAVVDAVIEGATFNKMKATSADVDAKKEEKGEKVKKNHIRKGKSGGWREVFSPEQAAAFQAHHAKKCAELGIPAEVFNFV